MNAVVDSTEQTVVAQELRCCLRVCESWPLLALPARQISQVAMDKQLALVPNTSPWFLGVLNMRGVLIPAFDMAAWAGEKPAAHGEFVILSPGPNAFALRSLGMPELLMVSPSDTDNLSPNPRIADFLLQSFNSERGAVNAFDPWRWLQSISTEIPQTSSTIR
jgi:chemotaxis signal transduction protein